MAGRDRHERMFGLRRTGKSTADVPLQDSSRLDWFVDGKKAGTWQTSRNLTYVQVNNASHMVRDSRQFVEAAANA